MKAREASPPLPVAATAPPSYDGGMIRLIDDETGALIGTVTEAHFKFLQDQLEEEGMDDRDYWFDADTLDMLAEEGADKDMIALLRKALGKREEMTVRWKKQAD